jgi:hypothetical protein
MSIIRELIVNKLNKVADAKFVEYFANEMEYSYFYGNNNVSLFWLANKTDKKFIKQLTKHIDDICTVSYNPKFASIGFNELCLDEAERIDLQDLKYDAKLDLKLLKLDHKIYPNNLVKWPEGVVELDGLYRPGFQAKAKTEFSLDINMIQRYRVHIIADIVKGISKQLKDGAIPQSYLDDITNYPRLVEDALDYYVVHNGVYNCEFNICDTRGRAIYQCQDKILNPINSKVGRALLVAQDSITIRVDEDGNPLDEQSKVALNDIWYAIHELTGQKSKYEFSARVRGRIAYQERMVSYIDELAEHILVQRIYDALDQLYANGSIEWKIPFEVDARASALMLYGIYARDAKALKRTSVVGSILNDPWFVPSVDRKKVKLITPLLYGSSETFKALAKHRDLCLTKSDEAKLKKEITSGDFKCAIHMKNMLIKTSNVDKPSFIADFGYESFEIPVNRFKVAGTKLNAIKVVHNGKEKIAAIHEPERVPDYKRFKLFLATGFIHSRDAYIMDKLCQIHDKDWLIPVHDATIALPGTLSRIRRTYADLIKQEYDRADETLRAYMRSIGATGIKAKIMLKQLYEMRDPSADDTTDFNPFCMK